MSDKAKAGEQSPAAYRIEYKVFQPSTEFLEEVASWFRHPQGKPWPTPPMVDHLARWVEHQADLDRDEKYLYKRYNEVFGCVPPKYRGYTEDFEFIKNIDKVKKYTEKRITRIRYEINDPEFKDSMIGDDEYYERDINEFEKLLNALETINARFDIRYIRKILQNRERKGRRRDWANSADHTLSYVRDVWARAGRTKPLSENHSGPLVHVLVQALQYQGYDVNEAGISKWLEER